LCELSHTRQGKFPRVYSPKLSPVAKFKNYATKMHH
jgi:hypothetical protein